MDLGPFLGWWNDVWYRRKDLESADSWALVSQLVVIWSKLFASLNFRFVIYEFLVLVSEKAMATHSSTLAWKIPWTEGPGRLQSMGSLGVRHD